MRIDVGSATITTVFEQELHVVDVLPQATPELISAIPWLRPHFADEDGNMIGAIQAVVVEHAGATIVVDTCVGNDKDIPIVPDWSDLHTRFLQDFHAAGFEPEAVDYVMCTHLHLDHVGWNTHLDGDQWRPTFPNARHLFARKEYEFWAAAAHAEPPVSDDASPLEAAMALFMQTQAIVQRQSVQPILDAGLAELVDPPCEPIPGIRLVETLGHTPGHVSVELTADGERALITGDAFHHPCQIAEPDWAALPDTDGAQSSQTRRDLLGQLAGTPTLMIGSHFAEPVGGRIVGTGGDYRLEPITN